VNDNDSIIAERAVLTMAREWVAQARTKEGHALPHGMDELALASLILAVEWGTHFTDVVWPQIEMNRELAAMRRDDSWMDELSWKLCQCAAHAPPYTELDAVLELTANLDHHNSSIRLRMMKLGWFVADWLNPVEASVRLLKNLADTLMGPLMAAGLAARFFDDANTFLVYACDFEPPEAFAEQYRERLEIVEEHGVLACQASFWNTEAECRRVIERCVLAARSPREIKGMESIDQGGRE
jgi:hypothetical protein